MKKEKTSSNKSECLWSAGIEIYRKFCRDDFVQPLAIQAK